MSRQELRVLYLTKNNYAVEDILQEIQVFKSQLSFQVASTGSLAYFHKKLRAERWHLLIVDFDFFQHAYPTVSDAIRQLGHFLHQCRAAGTDGMLAPTSLIVNECSSQLLGMVSEYQLSFVLPAKTLRQSLFSTIEPLALEATQPAEVQSGLRKIALLRSRGEHGVVNDILPSLRLAYPENTEFKFEQALCAYSFKKYQESLDQCNMILKERPSHVRALMTRGRCLMKLRRFAEATMSLSEADLLSPGNLSRIADIVRSSLSQHDLPVARSYLKDMKEINAEDPLTLQVSAETDLLSTPERLQAAVAFLSANTPPDERVAIFNNYGVVSATDRNYTNAKKLYELAAALMPNQELKAVVLYNLSIAHEKTGDLASAKYCINQALAANPLHAASVTRKARIDKSPEYAGSRGLTPVAPQSVRPASETTIESYLFNNDEDEDSFESISNDTQKFGRVTVRP